MTADVCTCSLGGPWCDFCNAVAQAERRGQEEWEAREAAPRLTHLSDQAGAALEDIAAPLAQFYRELVAEGIPPEQAIVLVERAMKRMGG